MEEKQKYAAFLRGINVGGHHKVPMAELRKLLEKTGYAEIKTFLNSGNVVFKSQPADVVALEEKMAAQLEKTFGFPVPVRVRKSKTIKEIISADPFKEVDLTNDIRQYVTFLKQPPKEKNKPDLPWISSDGTYKIISSTKTEIFSILDLSRGKTTDAMSILEKTFGNNITTRNWKTILKIFKYLSS